MRDCENPQCYNFNRNVPMYCDKCIQAEIDDMSYDDLTELFIEGKEWIDQLEPVEDEMSEKIKNDFKEGWFALLNIALLSKKQKGE